MAFREVDGPPLPLLGGGKLAECDVSARANGERDRRLAEASTIEKGVGAVLAQGQRAPIFPGPEEEAMG